MLKALGFDNDLLCVIIKEVNLSKLRDSPSIILGLEVCFSQRVLLSTWHLTTNFNTSVVARGFCCPLGIHSLII